MVLKLYGNPHSICTRRVAVVLHEKKVPFEFHILDFEKLDHKTAEFLKLQPFGQMPCIDDNGFVVYESRAVGRYIATKYASQGTPGLIPTELEERAIFEQAASVEIHNFDQFGAQAVFENVLKQYHGLTPDPEKFKSLVEQLSAKLDVYDQILGKQKYVAGNNITIADLYHLPIGTLLAVAGTDIMQQKPNVSRWFKEISSRSTWKTVVNGIESVASYN
ncbi:glutathione S-transferase [Cyathus striatus]|nr:glutathione S-transferase [Cyathus striatus]